MADGFVLAICHTPSSHMLSGLLSATIVRMAETTAQTGAPTAPPPALVNIVHLVYGLHALSLLIGVTTAATVVGAFVFGVPSIIAVVINYLKREEARGTFLDSHFRWQIRTFWFAVIWFVIGAFLVITVIGIPLAILVAFGAGLWVIYRIVRGWLALRDRKPMYT
jgi:uncharacterized membrane protein